MNSKHCLRWKHTRCPVGPWLRKIKFYKTNLFCTLLMFLREVQFEFLRLINNTLEMNQCVSEPAHIVSLQRDILRVWLPALYRSKSFHSRIKLLWHIT